jgi:putative heme iron utilization protein
MQEQEKPSNHQVPPEAEEAAAVLAAEQEASPAAPPEETPGETARRLIRSSDKGALATALAKERRVGWPYASLVLIACDQDASPLFLFSDLAEHAQNLKADERGSIMLDTTAGLANPLTGARVTVLGPIRRSDDPAHRRRFVSRHPSAAGYAQFADFHLYRMEVEAAHLVAGFGRIHWLTPAKFLLQPAPEIAAQEEDILQHMNQDHAAAIRHMAEVAGRDSGDWMMTGVDAEGCDLRCEGAVARIPFQHGVHTLEEVRAEMIRLARR